MDNLSIIYINQLWDELGLNLGELVSTAESNLSLKLDKEEDSNEYYVLTINEGENTFLTLGGLDTVYASFDESNKLTLRVRKLAISVTLIRNEAEVEHD